MKTMSIARDQLQFLLGASGLFLALLLSGVFHSARAQVKNVHVADEAFRIRSTGSDWKDCGLRKVDIDAFTSVRPEAVSKRSKTATIEVNYSGFSDEARVAFERAVSIWERHVESDVPIRIDASFESLDAGVLGGTRPQFAYGLDSDDDNQSEIFVIDALADALSGQDQQPEGPDFEMVLNSDRNDWHFGEEDAPSGSVDFTSVVLHEIAHGLGYIEFTDISNGTGEYGFDFNDNGEATPSIYTFFVAKKESDDSLVQLVNESEFPNPSTELGDALTSNQLAFNGEKAITTANPESEPVPPKVYAPANFNKGSSISHLDESAYPNETENALMTPRLNTAETNRLPGPLVCGQLKDMLWPLGNGCKRYLADVFSLEFLETPDPSTASVTLSWKVREGVDPEKFVVERKYFDGSFEPIESVQAPPVTIDSLGIGTFEFRIRWVRSDGSEGTTPQTVETTFRTRDLDAEIVERDEQKRAKIALSWAVPAGTNGYVYQVERQTGIGGPFKDVATVNETNYALERQTPGTYSYRITAVDQSGNSVVGADKAQVEVDFEGAVYVLGPYPNPVRNQASFELTARRAQTVTISVYNVAGQRLYSETRDVGAEAAEFVSIDASRWSSGMYFLRVRGREFTETQRLVVTR